MDMKCWEVASGTRGTRTFAKSKFSGPSAASESLLDENKHPPNTRHSAPAPQVATVIQYHSGFWNAIDSCLAPQQLDRFADVPNPATISYVFLTSLKRTNKQPMLEPNPKLNILGADMPPPPVPRTFHQPGAEGPQQLASPS